ncbi:hypothetical protein D3C87_1631950 [compost metagenome]
MAAVLSPRRQASSASAYWRCTSAGGSFAASSASYCALNGGVAKLTWRIWATSGPVARWRSDSISAVYCLRSLSTRSSPARRGYLYL